MMPPLAPDSLTGRRALIFGCGSSLDELTFAELRALWETDYLKVAVNYLPLSAKFHGADFKFDLLVWRDDCPAGEEELGPHCMAEAFATDCRFVKIGNTKTPGLFSQVVDSAKFIQAGGVAGQAAALLRWAGVREFVFVGIDLWGPHCKWAEGFDLIDRRPSIFTDAKETESSRDHVLCWRWLIEDTDWNTKYRCVGGRSLLPRAGVTAVSIDALAGSACHA